MQATFPLRRSSIQGFVIALAVAAVLILGAAGGYWLRSLAPHATTVTVARQAQQSSPTGSSQGLFGTSNPLATGGAAGVGAGTDELSTHRSGIQY